MGTLQPGRYRISNGAQGPGGTTLFLTFPSANRPLILGPKTSLTSQVWVVTGNPGMQSISPDTTGFQVNGAAAGDFIQATTNPRQWNINFDLNRSLYTIQTVGAALNWDLAGWPSGGQFVDLAFPSGNLRQFWKFKPVPMAPGQELCRPGAIGPPVTVTEGGLSGRSLNRIEFTISTQLTFS